MAFPLKLASVLSGATRSQLLNWRKQGLVVPEVRADRPPLYSYRDLLLLRTMVFLRAKTSNQRVRRAFDNLDVFDLSDHPSAYKFGTDRRTIIVQGPDGVRIDLLMRPGQIELISFEDLFEPFSNWRGSPVVDFRRPRRRLEVRPQRLGGWPTVQGTRVAFDTISNLVDGRTIRVQDVPQFYPSVSVEAARDALDLAKQVDEVAA